jgi:hypothetical protein
MKLEFSRKILERKKIFKYQISCKSVSWFRDVPYGYRQTGMTKSIVALRNFLNLPKKTYRPENLTGVKAKAVPLQAWSGPEGSTKLRFPDFMTTA